VAACAIPIEWSGLDGQALSLADDSVDAVLSTFTLCTIPNLQQALAEFRRVLRPGGTLHFLEHGRSPEPNVAKWQDRITPYYKPFAGGCHLNRAIDENLREAGFVIETLDNYYLKGPRIGTYLFEGRASRD
jgi:ubiquinone/menaquinone biosynthesis C-methylase UbiE